MSGPDADVDHVHAHGAHHHITTMVVVSTTTITRSSATTTSGAARRRSTSAATSVPSSPRRTAAALGTELFVRSVADPSVTIHTGVWERDHAGSTVAAAVFVELRAGTYEVLDERGAPIRDVVINGGAVTTADLRAGSGQNGVGIMSGSRSGSRYVPAS